MCKYVNASLPKAGYKVGSRKTFSRISRDASVGAKSLKTFGRSLEAVSDGMDRCKALVLVAIPKSNINGTSRWKDAKEASKSLKADDPWKPSTSETKTTTGRGRPRIFGSVSTRSRRKLYDALSTFLSSSSSSPPPTKVDSYHFAMCLTVFTPRLAAAVVCVKLPTPPS